MQNEQLEQEEKRTPFSYSTTLTVYNRARRKCEKHNTSISMLLHDHLLEYVKDEPELPEDKFRGKERLAARQMTTPEIIEEPPAPAVDVESVGSEVQEQAEVKSIAGTAAEELLTQAPAVDSEPSINEVQKKVEANPADVKAAEELPALAPAVDTEPASSEGQEQGEVKPIEGTADEELPAATAQGKVTSTPRTKQQPAKKAASKAKPVAKGKKAIKPNGRTTGKPANKVKATKGAKK